MGLRTFIKNFRYKYKYRIRRHDQYIQKSYFITGANSGIGLALTKKLLENNNLVFATYREKCDKLLLIKNKNLKIIPCNQEHLDQINHIKNYINNIPINILINNTGIWGSQNQDLEDLDYKIFEKTLRINALSALKFSEVILKNSRKNSLKIILNISSSGGSIENNNEGNAIIYRVSKTALNSITKNMSLYLKKKYNICCFAIDPGNVKTNLNQKGILDPETCANHIINIINQFNEDLNGKFIDLLKKEIPW